MRVLYNKVLNEIISIDITNKKEVLKLFQEYSVAKQEYDQIKYALKMVKQTGYGVATPSLEDMKFYNAEKGEWELDNSYTILAGTNSKNAKPVGRVEF